MGIPIVPMPLIIPSAEHKLLRCRCGHMDFGAHVRPLPHGGAVLKELVCRRCALVLKTRPADMSLERPGKTTDRKGEAIDV